MSTAVSTIQSLIGSYPLSLMTAHQWYSDPPTDSNATFGSGFFSGGDLPFGLVYELHNAPANLRYDWPNSLRYRTPLARIVNNAALHGGYGSTLPVEEFELALPRGVILFHEPSTTSIYVDVIGSAFLELWGLYIDIPLITPTQMGWTSGAPALPTFPPTFDGTQFVGLSGHGSFALDVATVGVRVDVTLLPGRAGRVGAEPATLFDVGYLTWCQTAGCGPSEAIRHGSYIAFPPLAIGYDHMEYDIPADVVCTFTCLLPNF